MKARARQQILVGGVGGQGVLFVTSLLAEAAISRKLPVLTSETHGMAQRGGTVVSHLKVGGFSSPMIRPAQADGLIALKQETIAHLKGYLKPGAWVVANRAPRDAAVPGVHIFCLDAEELAERTGNPKAANLVLLGFALAQGSGKSQGGQRLFCSFEELKSVLEKRLGDRKGMLLSCLRALDAGHGAA
jgi:indolepyruvate ferredoxin oxidoreductase beta subunit